MEIGNSEVACKIRKRRFPTASSSSFANNNNFSQLLVDISDLPRNEKCVDRLNDWSTCKEEESEMMTLQKLGGDDRVDEVFDKSITNVNRSRNKSRISPGRVSAPEVINPRYRHPCSFMEKDKSFGEMPLTYDAKPFEGKTRPGSEIMLKPTHGLDEIKHSLTVSKQLLKLLTHVWTADTNHDHHPMSISLATTLNHELNKARSHVSKLIREQQSNKNNTTLCESKEQDKIRLAVKTISRELETERKLRRQTERMNKKLGRELADTKSFLETEKQSTKILEQLCEKMARDIEEDRVELEELKKETERVRVEMEEEREMLRVADMLREERVHMKLIDAKYEYEDKHKQMNILVHDLEEVLEADSGIDQLKRSPRTLSLYQNTLNKGEDEKGKVENDENALGDETRDLSWYENNKGEVVNEAIGRNSDCIELEFGLEMNNGSEDLNGFLDERVLGFCSSTMKEYEDEMERYKMIKDLRDRIVSGSDISRDTLEFGSFM